MAKLWCSFAAGPLAMEAVHVLSPVGTVGVCRACARARAPAGVLARKSEASAWRRVAEL